MFSKINDNKGLISKNVNSKPKDGFINIGEFKKSIRWLSLSDVRSGIAILEETSSINSIDIHIAKQAISNNGPLIFSSSDIAETKLLINYAISNKRKNIYLFDGANQFNFNGFYCNKDVRLSLSDHTEYSLFEFLLSITDGDFLGDIYKEDYKRFLLAVCIITNYQKNEQNTAIDLKLIERNGKYNELKKYKELIKGDVYKKALEDIELILSSNLEKRVIFEDFFSKTIKEIKMTNLFNNNANEFKEIIFSDFDRDSDDYPIYIFLSNRSALEEKSISKKIVNYSDLLNTMILSLYQKFVASELSSPISEESLTDIFKNSNKNHNKHLTLIMRNPPKFINNLISMNRAVGNSLVFTFNDIVTDSYELDYVLANCRNIFYGKSDGSIEVNYNSSHSLTNLLMNNKEITKNDLNNLKVGEYLFLFKKLRDFNAPQELLKLNIT